MEGVPLQGPIAVPLAMKRGQDQGHNEVQSGPASGCKRRVCSQPQSIARGVCMAVGQRRASAGHGARECRRNSCLGISPFQGSAYSGSTLLANDLPPQARLTGKHRPYITQTSQRMRPAPLCSILSPVIGREWTPGSLGEGGCPMTMLMVPGLPLALFLLLILTLIMTTTDPLGGPD